MVSAKDVSIVKKLITEKEKEERRLNIVIKDYIYSQGSGKKVK